MASFILPTVVLTYAIYPAHPTRFRAFRPCTTSVFVPRIIDQQDTLSGWVLLQTELLIELSWSTSPRLRIFVLVREWVVGNQGDIKATVRMLHSSCISHSFSLRRYPSSAVLTASCGSDEISREERNEECNQRREGPCSRSFVRRGMSIRPEADEANDSGKNGLRNDTVPFEEIADRNKISLIRMNVRK